MYAIRSYYAWLLDKMKENIMIEKKKHKNKFLLMLLVGVSFISLLTSGCGNTKEDDTNVEEPTAVSNEDVIGDKEVDVFKLTKTSLIYENGSSTLVTSVYNIV